MFISQLGHELKVSEVQHIESLATVDSDDLVRHIRYFIMVAYYDKARLRDKHWSEGALVNEGNVGQSVKSMGHTREVAVTGKGRDSLKVERVCGVENPNPALLEKAKLILKEHEKSLLEAIAKLESMADLGQWEALHFQFMFEYLSQLVIQGRSGIGIRSIILTISHLICMNSLPRAPWDGRERQGDNRTTEQHPTEHKLHWSEQHPMKQELGDIGGKEQLQVMDQALGVEQRREQGDGEWSSTRWSRSWVEQSDTGGKEQRQAMDQVKGEQASGDG
ncbi:EMSY-LIKE 3 protein [Nymphaea thermarum]|nr:EMSY-LIKE 3 protein [Nymphaea thermarum]